MTADSAQSGVPAAPAPDSGTGTGTGSGAGTGSDLGAWRELRSPAILALLLLGLGAAMALRIARTEPPGADAAAPAAPDPVVVARNIQIPPRLDGADQTGAGAGDTARAPASRLALRPAPAPGLTEPWQDTALPRIGPEGDSPWRVYAAPGDLPAERPAIALVVGDMGFDSARLDRALETLPPAVGFIFPAYAPELDLRLARARRHGHEAWLGLPMEPADFPEDDAGPLALLSDREPRANLERTRRALARAPGVIGVTPFMGGGFLTDRAALSGVMDELAGRGLAWLDPGPLTPGVAVDLAGARDMPHATLDHELDAPPTRATLARELETLEAAAREQGTAIGLAGPYPVSFTVLAGWAAELESRGLALVPVSAILRARAAAAEEEANAGADSARDRAAAGAEGLR